MEENDFLTGSQSQVFSFKRKDLKSSFFRSSRISQRKFINSINYRNFIYGEVFALVDCRPAKEEYLIKVVPGPCNGAEVMFSLPEEFNHPPDAVTVNALLIDDGKSISWMQTDHIRTSSRTVKVRLHDVGTLYQTRLRKRYACLPVNVSIRYGDWEYSGKLNEFNSTGLRVDLDRPWQDPAETKGPGDIHIHVMHKGKKILSGTATLVRKNGTGKTIVLATESIDQTLLNQRKYRNPRLNLIPKPELVFTHPFTGRQVNYDIEDITSSGFSVSVESHLSMLMPGMIIDEATLEIAGVFKIRCSAQVVYGLKQKRGFIRYGILITDIDVETYTRLFNILSRSHDPCARVSYDIDMDSLWEFFFDTGFIYPDKYNCIADYKDDFKKTYEKLYHNCPDIFANVTYQHNGQIYGHVSLIKAYEQSWLVHHLAAKAMGRKITGLYILNQILNFFDGFDRMKSIGMRYMVFYFRPENRFPNYFFGGLARAFNDPSRLSLDIFAYLNLDVSKSVSLQEGWTISESKPSDIQELRREYKRISGGLMVDAFCLDAEPSGESIENLYRRHGLMRKCNTYILKSDDRTMAYLILDRSDRGINLSDLINSIKVIVPEGSDLPGEILRSALCECGKAYGTRTVAVQVFPCEYMDRIGFKYSKKYVMWTLDTNHFGTYIEYIKETAKFNPLKYAKRMVTSFIKNKI